MGLYEKLPKGRSWAEWFGFACALSLTVIFYFTTYGSPGSILECLGNCQTNAKYSLNAEYDVYSHDTRMCKTEERLDHLEKVCEKWRTIRHIRYQDPGGYWALLVDDTHKVLYCILPKAGSTSFQTMIINNTGKLSSSDEMAVHDPAVLKKLNFKYLHEYPFEEILWRLEHYFKFMVVRHPFARLNSAYEDKVKQIPYFKEKYGDLIKKHYPFHDPKNHSDPLTLTQFIELVVTEYDTGYKDRHWATYNEICHPCDIKYDYIGKLETLDEDLPNLLPRLKYHDGSIPNLQRLHHKRNIKKTKYTEAFQTISPALIRRLYSLYQIDFELYGYTWENGTVGHCSVKGDKHKSCC